MGLRELLKQRLKAKNTIFVKKGYRTDKKKANKSVLNEDLSDLEWQTAGTGAINLFYSDAYGMSGSAEVSLH